MSGWSEHRYSGVGKVSSAIEMFGIVALRCTNMCNSRGNGAVQHANHAAVATGSVFKHMMVLTDGMALKAVILGSLALAFLA